MPAYAGTKTAVFAGGCFWCMESEFEDIDGIVSVESGYSGGHLENPTYERVSRGDTGHRESVRVTYDPAKVSYEKLLEIYWDNVDPLDKDGQFCDKGDQYKSAIFVADAEQRAAATQSRQAVMGRLGQPVVTDILPAAAFWPAEAYHQDYAEKNSIKYRFYRNGCGRDGRLKQLKSINP